MKKILALVVSFLSLSALSENPPLFGSYTLSWGSLPNAKSYSVHYGCKPEYLNQEKQAGKNLSTTIEGLIPGVTYEFLVFTTLSNGVVIPGSHRFSYSVPNTGRIEMPSRGCLYYVSSPGKTVSILASTNLTDWTNIGARACAVPGVYCFQDMLSRRYSHRFYRTQIQ